MKPRMPICDRALISVFPRCAVERGADANGRDPIGVPIAVYALIRQEKAMFEMLARHGLDPGLTEETSGESVWETAEKNGWTEAQLSALFPGYSVP